jgi:hypothetical protein
MARERQRVHVGAHPVGAISQATLVCIACSELEHFGFDIDSSHFEVRNASYLDCHLTFATAKIEAATAILAVVLSDLLCHIAA